MRMKKIILLVSIACSAVLGVAQQDAMYTHYMFNTLAVNPGYAGSRDALTVTALHRSQWVGFDGAPTTQTLTIHSPVSSDKFGFGLSSVNDQIGPINTFSAYADFAYRIALGNQGSKLAFGFKGGLSMLSANLRALETETAGDQAFNNNIESQLLPNFGFGLYYSNSNWYVYLVRCRDGSLYTGIAKSPEKRVEEHNNDNQLGAKYTRARRPVKLVHQEKLTSRSLAAKRESEIKRLTKQQKELLVLQGKHPEKRPKSGKIEQNLSEIRELSTKTT